MSVRAPRLLKPAGALLALQSDKELLAGIDSRSEAIFRKSLFHTITFKALFCAPGVRRKILLINGCQSTVNPGLVSPFNVSIDSRRIPFCIFKFVLIGSS